MVLKRVFVLIGMQLTQLDAETHFVVVLLLDGGELEICLRQVYGAAFQQALVSATK